MRARDIGGKTLLRLAAENGSERVAGLLIATPGIDVNAVDNDARTPLTSTSERICTGLRDADTRA